MIISELVVGAIKISDKVGSKTILFRINSLTILYLKCVYLLLKLLTDILIFQVG